MFDAQCDFAAIAYEAGDDPDGLLLRFAEDLRRSGHRVVGVVQHHVHGSRDPNLDAVMLPGDEVVNLGHRIPGDDLGGCDIDNERLATVARTIEAAIEEGGDLVIINRFGKLEAAGRGLIRLIEQAVDADIPVITAVPAHRFAAWVKYSDGMSVRLACRRDALDAWWASVAGGVHERRGVCFCAFVK
jgi:nucleoside-triphosphatase THEP1